MKNFIWKKEKHLKEENPQEKSFYTYYKPQHKKKQDYGCDDDDAKRPW